MGNEPESLSLTPFDRVLSVYKGKGAQLQTVSFEECVSESACLACSEQYHGIKLVFSARGSRQPPPPTAANATACYSCRLLNCKQLINPYLPSSENPSTCHHIEQKLYHSNLIHANIECTAFHWHNLLKIPHDFLHSSHSPPDIQIWSYQKL